MHNHPDLVAYVAEQRQNGVTDAATRTALISSGWQTEHVDKALATRPAATGSGHAAPSSGGARQSAMVAISVLGLAAVAVGGYGGYNLYKNGHLLGGAPVYTPVAANESSFSAILSKGTAINAPATGKGRVQLTYQGITDGKIQIAVTGLADAACIKRVLSLPDDNKYVCGDATYSILAYQSTAGDDSVVTATVIWDPVATPPVTPVGQTPFPTDTPTP